MYKAGVQRSFPRVNRCCGLLQGLEQSSKLFFWDRGIPHVGNMIRWVGCRVADSRFQGFGLRRLWVRALVISDFLFRGFILQEFRVSASGAGTFLRGSRRMIGLDSDFLS